MVLVSFEVGNDPRSRPFKRSIEMASHVGGEVGLYLLIVSHISQRALEIQGETVGAYPVMDAGSQVEYENSVDSLSHLFEQVCSSESDEKSQWEEEQLVIKKHWQLLIGSVVHENIQELHNALRIADSLLEEMSYVLKRVAGLPDLVIKGD
jgi:hypothetical protein